MIDTLQLREWFDSQVKRIDRLIEEKSYYYHACPELYEKQLREQRYYYSMTILELTQLVNNDKHLPKIEAWEIVKTKIKFEDLGETQSGNVYRAYIYDYFGEKEYQKYQKALEVEE